MILKVQRTSVSFKSWFWALVGGESSWLGFSLLIFTWIWSLVFDPFLFQILALYLDSEVAKNIHVLQNLIWGSGRCWSFLTWVWHLDHHMDGVTGLRYTKDPNFGSLSWFWRCKEHPCPLSPHLGLWRMLEVPDWGWFGYGHWSLIHWGSKFWLSILIF